MAGSWRMPAPIPTGRGCMGCVGVGSRVYCIGGTTGYPVVEYDNVDIFDTVSETWQMGTPKPTPSSRFGCAAVGDQIFCIGGMINDGDSVITDAVEVYDSSANNWRQGTKLPMQLYDFGCVAVESSIYCIGGWDTSGVSHRTFVYDVDQNDWRETAECPEQILGYMAACIDNRIYIPCTIGGEGSTMVLNIETQTWSHMTAFPESYGGYSCNAMCGRLYCAGGYRNSTYHTALQVFDPASNSWRHDSDMTVARHRAGAAVVGNKLYVVGGLVGSNAFPTNAVEIYTPDETCHGEGESGCGCCAKVRIQIEGCSSNELVRQVCGLVQQSDCDCRCDCK